MVMDMRKFDDGLLPLHVHHHTHASSSLLTTAASSSSSSSSAASAAATTNSNTRNASPIYSQNNFCFRFHRFLFHSFLLNYLLPIIIIMTLIIIFYLSKDYVKSILLWIEQQNIWLIFCVYLCLFTIVSFPITVGYLVLIITSGYLFGKFKGLLTVILGANIGVVIAHNTIKSLQNKLPLQRLIKNDTGRAILRVISGPRAFKVVLLARLTPIPFGLQNTIFGVSNINPRSYHTGTLIGLLPAQTINVYIGSTLRSMHDVLSEHNTALASYSVFAIQVLIGILLMIYVVHKARGELSEALLSEFNGNHIIDIEV